MKEELENQINIIKEVLSAMPRNNKKNIEKYKEEIKNNIKLVEEDIAKVVDIFKKSNSKYDKLVPNPEIEILKNQKMELEKKLKILNNNNSSFEKLGLDVILYDISKYYKGNLKETNTHILQAVSKFKEIGVELSIKDFGYCHYVREYMEEFFKGGSDFEDIFEQIYWKCPNIITYIGLNIRYLYIKNKKYFDKYIQKKQKEILKDTTVEEINKEYDRVVNKYEELISKDTYLNFEKFKQKALKTTDYSKDKIEKIYSQFIKDNSENLYNEVLIKLSNNIKEYKNYLKYRFIFDEVKKLYIEKDNFKNISKTKLKEISKLEKKLIFINKKYEKTKNSNKKAKLDLEINNYLKNINNLYLELENNIFNEQVLQLSDNDTIKKLFEISSSYYIFLVKCIKENNIDITSEEINNTINEFISFVLNPNNTMINNLNISEEYNFPMIISDKYKLVNVEVSIESLEEENLENLLSQLKMIIDYNIFNNLEINFKEIEDYCKIQEILNSID